ncbi:active breakpoint cluster region-related protein-like isoform X2 [Watersipora subatra]|uniref:active breakpoint cluster region-related protein-like isoform X2 n=1 Tax=Watersipora subatra TaxID=2589382 RepID=UPI00355BA42A
MTSLDMNSKLDGFKSSWNDRFPGVPVPRLSFLEENVGSGCDIVNDKQQYRRSLQAALDYHNIRISDLEKKLEQQQFILEYVAKELEELPVPRESASSPFSQAESKPMPLPRKPPAIPKKPAKSSMRGVDSASGILRRNHSTPSPRQIHPSDRRAQFSSVVISSEHTINETLSTDSYNSQKNFDSSDSTDDRFQGFQGTTFGSPRNSQNSASVKNSVSNPIAGGPAIIENQIKESCQTVAIDVPTPCPSKVTRDSMKKIDRICIQDTESSGSSSPEKSPDYMQLWTVRPSSNSRTPSVSSEAPTSCAEESIEDHSTSASRLSGNKPVKKASSRMVRVDYSCKESGPQPIRDESDDNANSGEAFDSDEEDDNPQYVRLVYNAYSNVHLVKGDDTDSLASSASLEAESSPSPLGKDKIKRAGESQVSVNEADSSSAFQMGGSVTGDSTDSFVDNDNLQMRNWVVNSVLESEKSYIDDLNVLIQYKKSLESAAQSSIPMLPMPEINAIFGNLPAIHEVHSRFREQLEPIVAEWTPHSEVGALFKEMAVNLQHYNTYLTNYPNAIATLKRCCQENKSFEDLVNLIKCPSTGEMHHLQEILHKPINRIQRNSLLLQDLINCTPVSHADYDMLQRALKLSQHFLREQMSLSAGNNGETPLHVLVKNQLLVEYIAGKARKLRHVFIFHDLIVCTKCEIEKGKQHYVVKWYALLSDLQLSDRMDDTPVEWKKREAKAEKEIQMMKGKLKDSKEQLRREFKECKDKNMDRSTNMKIQRLTKKIHDQEANLILAEPRLRFTFSTTRNQQFCFLLPSDYERRDLQETIQALKAKLPVESTLKMTLQEVQSIIDMCKENAHLNNVNQMVMKEATDEDIVNGQLTVTIHKILGLQASCETFTDIEVDSFGHFNLKAKTTVVNSDKPVWNESFAIDLESSSTLRLICYKKTADGDVLLGKCPLNLHKQWLKQGFQEKELSMNEVTLTLSIKYKTAEQTIHRIPSRIESGIFGVRLASTCNKEGLKVPAFISACIEDVERRGIDEMGIYRVSGTTSDVQRIRKAFDKNSRVGKALLPETDINAVTGALKLYLRELPEALITDALYPSMKDAYQIQDKGEQEKQMIALLGSLPDPNYHTMMAILEHLVRVGEHESKNKMPFHNLAVVFGPTLLKPAVKKHASDTINLLSSGANDAMCQSGIIFYYLTLLKKGVQFR